MRNGHSRRSFVKALVSAPLVPWLAEYSRPIAAGGADRDSSAAKVRLEPFDYRGVRLLEGRLQKQYLETRDFYYKLSNDNALKGFRHRAGLPAPGVNLGGWYGGEPALKEFPGLWWAGGDTYNVFPQWLSGMSRMYAATGDQAIREKAHTLMLEWAKTIEPDGYFYYSREPRTFHYTYEKTVCGLVDMAMHGGCQDALPLLDKITDWAAKNLARTRKSPTPEDFTAGGSEWYTLSENLYRAYQLTGNPKYRDFGDLWHYTPYWSKFINEADPDIHGLHAYSHVNTLSSAAMTYAVTGDPQFLKVIVNAYDYLERTQFYATGGFGPAEKLVLPDGSLGRSLEVEPKTFETPCGSWACFKLGKYLLRFTGEARFGDWIEKMVYNGIGAALPMSPDGRTFYYADYRLGGGRKIYHPEWRWPCCAGTYAQAVADYHNLIYFKDPTGLYVNLFVPSEVTWNLDGNEIKVEQATDYPEAGTTNLIVRPQKPVAFDLKFRVPRWLQGATVKVNDAPLEVSAQPGTWATIRRTWNTGDRVTVQFAVPTYLVPIDKQHPRRVALMRGPVVLVRTHESLQLPSEASLNNWLTHEGNPVELLGKGQSAGTFVPFYRVGLEVPYGMYFDLAS